MFWKHCFNKYATFYCIQFKNLNEINENNRFLQETQFRMDKINRSI